MPVWAADVTWRFVGEAGGVVSGQALVGESALACDEALPAASFAATASVYVVPQLRPEYE